jgi:hypothetical protein
MMEDWRVVPRFRRDGTLPSGVYQATVDEFLAPYPPVNQQRQVLNDSLRRVAEELRKLDPLLVIYIDGSYITSKDEPNDVDLLAVTAHHSTRALVNHLNRVCPVEAVSLDINAEPAMPNPIFDLFTETRTGKRQGILDAIAAYERSRPQSA